MSEPVKKAGQSPKSYSPKDKPEIISMAESALRKKRGGQPPSEFVIVPEERIAAFSGDRWPYSNVEPAVYSALGLLYGRTDRRDDSGALINDDIEYSIHNVLTGHAFGLFYCLPDDSLSMSFYGLKSCRLNKEDYPGGELTQVIKELVYGGSAVHINEGGAPFDYLIWGYREDGNILIGHKFEHGNDDVNCSYDFVSPAQFPPSKDIESATFYLPDGEKSGHGDIYRQALAVGHGMLTQSEPPLGMDFGRVHFGYGNAIYEEWIRQLEQANAENSTAFYFSSPVFPHFIALYENRLQLHKFLKLFAEENGSESLLKASVLCGQLKDLAQEGAQIGFENQWSDPEVLAMSNNQRRDLLIELLKKCRALELETASAIKEFLDASEGYFPKDKPEILNILAQSRHRVIKTGHGSYIDGVPPIKWGEWRDCTYSGCMTLLLNALGIKATYEQVMGLTGSCYRASMAYGWDPGSNIVNITYAHLGINSDRNANRRYGIDDKPIDMDKTTDEEREVLVRESIDVGVPVLILNSTPGPAEWGIILGYEKKADGFVYFGRSYFDGNYYGRSYFDDNAPEHEIFTANRYVLAFDFPNNVFSIKLFNIPCDPTPPLVALKTSLKACLETFAPHEKFGYGAYEMMINSFVSNKFTSDFMGNGEITNIFETFADARKSAYIYLRESANLLSGVNKDNLLMVSSLYKKMFDIFQEAIGDKDFNQNVITASEAEEVREKFAEKLRQSKDLEYKVRDIVKKVLENWEETK